MIAFFNFVQWLSLELGGKNYSDGRLIAPFSSFSRFRNTLSPRRIKKIKHRLTLRGKYLEIGVQRGFTLEAVGGGRVGVDPHPLFDTSKLPPNLSFHTMTSRSYFDNSPSDRFDFVFLDGLHTFQETYFDFVDSLRLLNRDGVILIDDVFPSDEPSSQPDMEIAAAQKAAHGIEHGRWYGDVWRLGYHLLFGSASEFFDCVAVGSGGADHCQLLVTRRPGRSWNPEPEKDISEMGALGFEGSVFGPGKSVSSAALGEKVALKTLGRSSK